MQAFHGAKLLMHILCTSEPTATGLLSLVMAQFEHACLLQSYWQQGATQLAGVQQAAGRAMP